MKLRMKYMWMQFLALLFVVSVAHAQPAQPNFSQPELEQMLAPIALYPDALLSQVLMAVTYSTEVVEASYWLKANPGLRGENAIRAAENQQWDISVKSLLPFPQVLGTMESKLEWTENLGNAFLGQEQQVMDTIQLLRQKAMAAGYLRSDNRVRVVAQDQLISIDLVQPTAVYVPYYNPTVVYGTWWAPSYAPVYWDPWPGYAVAPGYNGWYWAAATIVTAGVLYAAFDWRRHNVYYGNHVNYWQRHYDYSHYRYSGTGTHQWSHDPTHRRDIPYRSPTVNQRFGSIATTYNAKVGPRPTVQDIRTGKHKFTPVSGTTSRTGAAVIPSRTGATTKTTSTPVRTTRKTGTGPGPTGGKSNAKPQGKAYGVRGTQPSAKTKATTVRSTSPANAPRTTDPSRMERSPAPARTERATGSASGVGHGASAPDKKKPQE